MNRPLLTAILLASAQAALAHDGPHHGDLAQSLWHLFSQPSHWALLTLFLAPVMFWALKKTMAKKAAKRKAHATHTGH